MNERGCNIIIFDSVNNTRFKDFSNKNCYVVEKGELFSFLFRETEWGHVGKTGVKKKMGMGAWRI